MSDNRALYNETSYTDDESSCVKPLLLNAPKLVIQNKVVDFRTIDISSLKTYITSLKTSSSPITTSLKIIVLGDKNVGKTTFINNVINSGGGDNDNEKSRIKIIPNDVVYFEIETEEYDKIRLYIWDTVGEEYSEAITSNIFRDANGIIILYDITNRKSYHNVVNRWIPRIKTLLGDGGFGNDIGERTQKKYGNIFKILIVANKIDLYSKRTVTDEECRNLTDLFMLPYIQLSTLHDQKDTIKIPFIILTKSLMPYILSSDFTRRDFIELSSDYNKVYNPKTDKEMTNASDSTTTTTCCS